MVVKVVHLVPIPWNDSGLCQVAGHGKDDPSQPAFVDEPISLAFEFWVVIVEIIVGTRLCWLRYHSSYVLHLSNLQGTRRPKILDA